MGVTLAELAERFDLRLLGDGEVYIDSIATLKHAQSGELAFLSNSKYTSQLQHTAASVVVLSEENASLAPCAVLIAKDPYLAYTKISRFLHPQLLYPNQIAASAIVANTAQISPKSYIGEQVVIGEDVVIHDHVQIHAGTVIENNVEIAEGSIIKANVSIAFDCQIGKNCLIQSGAVIGSDGFGFARDDDGWLKIPQLGRVIIGNDVEVGANTTIDRGALEDTLIGDGVKLDNQIQIAHNVVIGEHTAIAACCGIAGSTRIGKYCTIAGSVGIVGHLTLVDHVHVSAKSLVTKSLMSAGYYSGNLPAVSNKEWKRSVARIRKLDNMVERLHAIEKILEQQ